MPRFLSLGHVTWDGRPGDDILGGSVSYAALCAQKLDWQAGVLTAAGPEFDPGRELPGIATYLTRGARTTRFQNAYGPDGERTQLLLAQAPEVALDPLPGEWRAPEVLLLSPVIGELGSALAPGFSAGVVGAIAQGYVRGVDAEGRVAAREWPWPRADLEGVHVLFLSEHDLPDAEARVPAFLEFVPLLALTRGWRGLTLFTRDGRFEVPAWPRPEVDPTGAGDVFAAAFLLRYHETEEPLEAAAFAACAASCVVEGPGATTLGDRPEIERRLALREKWLEDGEWEE